MNHEFSEIDDISSFKVGIQEEARKSVFADICSYNDTVIDSDISNINTDSYISKGV